MITVEFINNDYFIITGQFDMECGYAYIIDIDSYSYFTFISKNLTEAQPYRLYTRGRQSNFNYQRVYYRKLNVSKKDFLEFIDLLNSGKYKKVYSG